MSGLANEIVIEPNTKRGKHEGEDKLSDLPDCVLLHVLSFIKESNTKQAVQTSILSTRWKHLWKRLPALILHSDNFSTLKSFDNFVSGILRLRDASIPLHTFDFNRNGSCELILKRIANYVFSHSVHLQQLSLFLRGDSSLILPCISSCPALTSLKLSLHPKGRYTIEKTLFPESLNLPTLTTLDLTNFDFCTSDDNANNPDPFSTFKSLNTLIICSCGVKDAQILSISSPTLANLTIDTCFSDLPKIELSAPSLSTFTFTGVPHVRLCGSTLFSIEQVNIDAFTFSPYGEPPLVLLSWLLDLPNINSLKVTSTTLLVLSLVRNLLKLKLASLYNLKLLQVEMTPLPTDAPIFLQTVMLMNKSQKEAAKIKRAFKVGLEPSATIPDRIVGFLIQNSPLAKVDIIDNNMNPRKLMQHEMKIQ